jgi:hypothetical protein
MLFLLNDAVLELEMEELRLPPRLRGQRLRSLSFYGLVRLGQELFSENPLLQYARPGRAQRLASLIVAKAPAINAALFVAPAFHCPVGEVQASFANVDPDLMSDLHERQEAGSLDMVAADRQVWRRLAA